MAFRVTQCPACQSTFATNAALLNAAAGKVRCGACLHVFKAEAHFLANDPVDDEAELGSDSVFVGSAPHDYFDPNRFVARHQPAETVADDWGGPETNPAADDEAVADEAGTTALSHHETDLLETDNRAAVEDLPEPIGPGQSAGVEVSDLQLPASAAESTAGHQGSSYGQGTDNSETGSADQTPASASPEPGLEQDSAVDHWAPTQNDAFSSVPDHGGAADDSAAIPDSSSQAGLEGAQLQYSISSEPVQIDRPEDLSLRASFSLVLSPLPPAAATEEAASLEPDTLVGADTDSPAAETGEALHQDSSSDAHSETVNDAAAINDEADEADVSLPGADVTAIAEQPTTEQAVPGQDRQPGETAPNPDPHSQPGLTGTWSEEFDAGESISDFTEQPILDAETFEPIGDAIQEQQFLEAVAAGIETDPLFDDSLDPMAGGENHEALTEQSVSFEFIAGGQQTDSAPPTAANTDSGQRESLAAAAQAQEQPTSNSSPEDALTLDSQSATAEALAPQQEEPAAIAEEQPSTPHEALSAPLDEAPPAGQESPVQDREAPAQTAPVSAPPEPRQESEPADLKAAIRERIANSSLKEDSELDHLNPESLEQLKAVHNPLELQTGDGSRWLQRTGLFCLCVLLAASLIGQHAWRMSPVLARSEDLRAYYLLACDWLDCRLPPYSNIDAIRSDRLDVRSHPDSDQALQVNIAFRNSAPFPQDFPILILSFNSAQNQVIALREFAPSEYLGSGLSQFRQMPPDTPVQVELQVMDPGPFAANYTLAFRRP